MKFLITLLTFNFLCVWCFGLEDCEGDDLICEELLPVRPELNDAIAYEDNESALYGFEGSNTSYSVLAFRRELEAGVSQSCQDGINTGFSVGGIEEDGFSLLLSTDVFNQNLLHFDFTFTFSSRPTEREVVSVSFDASGEASVLPPLELRVVPDTLLAGVTYQDFLLVELPEATESGKVKAFYYNTTDGLLRVERIDRPAFLRMD
jgi:hypothetical protein